MDSPKMHKETLTVQVPAELLAELRAFTERSWVRRIGDHVAFALREYLDNPPPLVLPRHTNTHGTPTASNQ